MKYIIGFLVTLLLLVTLTYFVLQTWDIELFDGAYLAKTWITFAFLGVGALLLVVVVSFFFRNPAARYEKGGAGVAQKKRE